MDERIVRIKSIKLITGQAYTNCFIDPEAIEIDGFVAIRAYKAVPIDFKEELHYISRNAIASITIEKEDHKKLYSALL